MATIDLAPFRGREAAVSAKLVVTIGVVLICFKTGLPSNLWGLCGCRYVLMLPSAGDKCEDVAFGDDCFP